MLIIGDSIVRDVKSRMAVTVCYPGAKVADLINELPGLLSQYCTIQKVIVHIGTNDTVFLGHNPNC